MAVLWCRETVRDRSLELAKKDGGSGSRSWIARVDDPATSLTDIRAASGVLIGDQHPDDASLVCQTISVKSADDTGMLYSVSADYKPDPTQSSDSDEDDPGGMDGLVPVWGGSSSVASEPVYLNIAGNTMTNSAGEPLEGLEAEQAQFHLTKTTYYSTHEGGGGWLAHARTYTNSINSDVWNGGQPGQWKCQGCSAKLNIDRQGEQGAARVYWEVSWDFAFRADYWRLTPWDIGFNELCDDEGNPIEVYGVSDSGGGGSGEDGACGDGINRRAIRGQDGKPVRQPVALQNGKAKGPGCRPDALLFEIYASQAFGAVFGEVTTPTP